MDGEPSNVIPIRKEDRLHSQRPVKALEDELAFLEKRAEHYLFLAEIIGKRVTAITVELMHREARTPEDTEDSDGE